MLYNWLVLAVSAFLVGIYIAIFESIWKDKGYLYFILSAFFGVIFYVQKKRGKF